MGSGFLGPMEPSDYTTPPPMDVPTGIALAHALMAAKPPAASPSVEERAADVAASLKALETEWAARGGGQAPAAAPDARAADTRVDVAFGALYRRLSALAELVGRSPRAAAAAGLRDRIYGTERPLEFLKLRFDAQWAHARKRHQAIVDGSLGPQIDELAGPEFLPELVSALDAYGVALAITSAAPATQSLESLLPLLRELQSDIGAYQIALLGMLKKNDRKSTDVVAAALKPIDDHRVAFARSVTPSPKAADDAPTPVDPNAPVKDPPK